MWCVIMFLQVIFMPEFIWAFITNISLLLLYELHHCDSSGPFYVGTYFGIRHKYVLLLYELCHCVFLDNFKWELILAFVTNMSSYCMSWFNVCLQVIFSHKLCLAYITFVNHVFCYSVELQEYVLVWWRVYENWFEVVYHVQSTFFHLHYLLE